MDQPKRRGRPPKNPPENNAVLSLAPAPAPAQPPEQHEESQPGQPVDTSTKNPETMAEVSDLPLFAGTQFSESRPAFIVISRQGPVYEGSLGKLEPYSTEDDIKRLYGGGTYRLEAKSNRGWGLPNGTKQVTIGGEPIFQSDGARVEYAKFLKNHSATAPAVFSAPSAPPPAPPAPMPSPAPAASNASAAPDGNSMVALFAAIMTAQGQQTAAMMQAQAQQTGVMMTLIMEQAKSKEEANLRFFELMKSNAPAPPADPVTILKEGMRLMRSVSGGKGEADQPDVLGKVLEAAPKLMGQAASLIRGEAALKQQQQQAPAAPPTRTAMQAVYDEIDARPDAMLLEGELGTMANKAIEHLRSLGVPPEVAIAQVWTTLSQVTREQAVASGLVAGVEPPAAQAPMVEQQREPSPEAA